MTILDAAKKDLGVKEYRGGFDNKEFEVSIKSVGWRIGWTWNSIVIGKWIKDAYPDREELVGLIEHSAVVSFKNLEKAGLPVSMVPTLGALVYWQRIENGAAIWIGRAGVVSQVVNDYEFFSIEGNLNVQEVRRTLDNDIFDGLKVIGFVTV